VASALQIAQEPYILYRVTGLHNYDVQLNCVLSAAATELPLKLKQRSE